MTDIEKNNIPEQPVDAPVESPVEEVVAEPAKKLTKEDILNRLKEIENDVESASRVEIDGLKQAFYKIHVSEAEEAKQQFIANGGAEADFLPTPDPLEEEFKQLMSAIKEKRNQTNAELEKQKEMNLQVKLSIIEELKDLIESTEDPNKNYAEFKRLQQQWNEVTLIPQGKANELWKNYQLNVEKFYDLLKLNNEFREYDFKKNQAIKIHLCEAAERLTEEPDVVSAFHQLQKLHQEFRDTGPVAKDLREEIWTRFKNASTIVNRRHQKHFEQLKEQERQNLDQKTVICEIVESIDFNELKSFSDWDNKTKEIIALQNKWKTIGFAPQKMNTKIFERFRKACDEFFHKKAEFFKETKDVMTQNLEKKRALIEKAEALKDSTDWKATSEQFVKLQKEWKEIGPVARKYSDAIWKKFIGACDYFFEQKGKATSSQRSTEQINLEKKKSIISQLKELQQQTDDPEIGQKVRDLMKEWNETGHVPFREKDKIYKQYHELVDNAFKQFNMSGVSRKFSNFKSAAKDVQDKGVQSIYKEREKLVRNYETMKSELITYQNNLGFLTASSKKGNSLLDELNKKVEKLQEDIKEAEEKIREIDKNILEQQGEQE
ncbi:MAG: DUF349 domain-containing protein [Bacteroidaceae bacterium]|nr:DUF349 domain-containing protein [Bacteroidaceae bacterium]